MTAEGVSAAVSGQERRNSLPDDLDDAGTEREHGTSIRFSGWD